MLSHHNHHLNAATTTTTGVGSENAPPTGLGVSNNKSNNNVDKENYGTPLRSKGLKAGGSGLSQRDALGSNQKTTKTKTTKTPFAQRRALGNITNRTPKTGGQASGGLGSKPGTAKKATPGAGLRARGGGPRPSGKTPSGASLLAREVDRRADLFAEDGAEEWLGDTFEHQQRWRDETDARSAKEAASEVSKFMCSGGPVPAALGPLDIEPVDCPPLSFEDLSEAEDLDALLAADPTGFP